MADRGIGWGIASLLAIALLSLVAIGAWAYRAYGLTSTIHARWPALEPGSEYARIDHTAPWSEPWSKLCLVDRVTSAERWCRSVPEGAQIATVVERPDGLHVTLDVYEWVLETRDGHTISPLPR